MKRARESYDLLKRWPGLSKERREGLGDLIVSWERLQLSAEGLFVHLMHAVRERASYEKFLDDLARQPGKREERCITQILVGGRALIELMRKSGAHETASSGRGLADLVECWIDEYNEARSLVSKKTRGRGRPGEPWLRWYVLHFAEQLRGVGESWRRTRHVVHVAFQAIQMGDVVTEDKVWHVIRDARDKDPGFGTGPARPCSLCWGSRAIGQALKMIRDEPARLAKGTMAVVEKLRK